MGSCFEGTRWPIFLKVPSGQDDPRSADRVIQGAVYGSMTGTTNRCRWIDCNHAGHAGVRKTTSSVGITRCVMKVDPQDWECDIARKVLEFGQLELKKESNFNPWDTSVYISTEETVKACERKKES